MCYSWCSFLADDMPKISFHSCSIIFKLIHHNKISSVFFFFQIIKPRCRVAVLQIFVDMRASFQVCFYFVCKEVEFWLCPNVWVCLLLWSFADLADKFWTMCSKRVGGGKTRCRIAMCSEKINFDRFFLAATGASMPFWIFLKLIYRNIWQIIRLNYNRDFPTLNLLL